MNARKPDKNAVPVEALTERDIDLLLLEELHVSAKLAALLVRKAFPPSTNFSRFLTAQRSVVGADGESDLELQFITEDGKRCCLLIENKITAIAQLDQAERYHKRAAIGQKEERWELSRCCIIAPRSYLGTAQATGYDAQISYEEIVDHFESAPKNDARAAYRAARMKDAVSQARRGYVAKEDVHATAFWKAYWADVSVLFPELEMKPPEKGKPANSTWIVFKPKKLDRRQQINHKLNRGVVDLSTAVPVEQIGDFRKEFGEALRAGGLEATETGKSVSVSIAAPIVDIQKSFDSQMGPAREGMRAAYRLLYLSWLFADTPRMK